MDMYNKKIPTFSSHSQTDEINQMLGNARLYSVDDIFNLLPNKIEYNGKVGYLRISKFDIVWSSLETESEGKVVLMFQYLLSNENIFDAFIRAYKFINENNVTILEQ